MSILPERFRRVALRTLGADSRFASEEGAYRRLVSKGWNPAGIIDVGAYEGSWTRMVRGVFPAAPVLMVEAQRGMAARLQALCSELRGVGFASAVLGTESGKEVTFFEMGTGSSYLPERSNAPRTAVKYRTKTLDEVAESFAGPLFLKVDVQGAELDVLAGGSATLERSEVVQLEVPLVAYNEGAPSLLDVLRYMEQREYALIDICGFARPNQVDLVHADFLFVRRNSPLRLTRIQFEHYQD